MQAHTEAGKGVLSQVAAGQLPKNDFQLLQEYHSRKAKLDASSMGSKWSRLSRPELRELLAAQDLPTDGAKQALVARLTARVAAGPPREQLAQWQLQQHALATDTRRMLEHERRRQPRPPPQAAAAAAAAASPAGTGLSPSPPQQPSPTARGGEGGGGAYAEVRYRLMALRPGVAMAPHDPHPKLSDSDYADGTSLRLLDGRDSLGQRSPRQDSSQGRGGRARRPFASPRTQAAGAAADVAQVAPTEPAAASAHDVMADTDGVGGADGEPVEPPPFPTPGYWLPPLSRHLTSRYSHQSGDHVIGAQAGGRTRPEVPARWSITPTPLSRYTKPRYTLPHSGRDDELQRLRENMARQKESSPFAQLDGTSLSILKDTARNIRGQDYQQALVDLNQLVDLYPRNARLLTMRAMCLSKLGNHKQALSSAKQALLIDPREVKANYYAGISAGEIGKSKMGASFLSAALSADPSSNRYRRAFDQLVDQAGTERKFHNLGIYRSKEPPKRAPSAQRCTP
jgi:hypothetical protein